MKRGERFGPFLILYGLAHGGISQIHRARYLGIGDTTDMVVKRLREPYNEDDEFVQMLTDEAELMNALRHPNIAHVSEFGLVGQQYFLATEYVDGVNLYQLLKRLRRVGGLMCPDVALFILIKSLAGLHHAHEFEQAIVHRDFTPSNLMLGFDGAVKLIDFGIAKSKLTRTKTRGGVIKGKLKYMSPEQTRGEAVSPQSDVFSAGVVAYECFTGHQPFLGEGEADIIRNIRHGHPKAASQLNAGLDDDLDRVLETAMAKSLACRYSSVADFQRDLMGWANRNRQLPSVEGLITLLAEHFSADRREANAQAQAVSSCGGDEDDEYSSTYTRIVGLGYHQPNSAEDVSGLGEESES